jgi:hypothetical protein
MTQGQGSKCAKCVYGENLLTAVNVETKFRTSLTARLVTCLYTIFLSFF